jgi:hypothetical protein
MRTFTVAGDRVELFVPLMKFDVRTGEFEGRATVEEIDGHKEICDVEKSWPALVQWAAESEELSKGKSVGNVRVQHRRDSLGGKLTLMERRDMDGVPSVFVTGVITDEQAKAHAADGTITGLSFRGLAAKWDDVDLGAKRYAWREVEEISLVDRPAVARALIEVVKSDGGIEMVKALGRQPVQWWDCGIEECAKKHEHKDEAIGCEGIPTRVEATAKSEDDAAPIDSKKALYRVADLVALLSTLLCITSDVEWDETWNAINGQTGDSTISDQLKQIAQRVFDALEAIVADERRKLDEQMAEDAATEMAMSAAIRTITSSETVKQLLKSLRVPSGNGSSSKKETENKEGTMDIIEVQKAADARIRATLAPLAKAMGGDENAADIVAEVAKAYNASTDASKATAAKVEELEKNLKLAADTFTEMSKAQAKTLALVTGVKVKDDSNLGEVLEAIKNKPGKPEAAQRLVPVAKSDDTGDTKPPAKELTTLEKLSPANRQRIV